MKKNQCKTCRWWHHYDDELTYGECRRFPPTNNTDVETTDGGTMPIASWVETDGDDWCGEWSPTDTPSGLSDVQLARAWNIKAKGWTESYVARWIKHIKEILASGVDNPEDVCRITRCRRGTKRWEVVSEITNRLTGNMH
jgi:hypothetical protein